MVTGHIHQSFSLVNKRLRPKKKKKKTGLKNRGLTPSSQDEDLSSQMTRFGEVVINTHCTLGPTDDSFPPPTRGQKDEKSLNTRSYGDFSDRREY